MRLMSRLGSTLRASSRIRNAHGHFTRAVKTQKTTIYVLLCFALVSAFPLFCPFLLFFNSFCSFWYFCIALFCSLLLFVALCCSFLLFCVALCCSILLLFALFCAFCLLFFALFCLLALNCVVCTFSFFLLFFGGGKYIQKHAVRFVFWKERKSVARQVQSLWSQLHQAVVYQLRCWRSE